MLRRLFTALTCATLPLAASGCFFVDDSGPPPSAGTGLLTTYWTLDGEAFPDICAYYGVDRVDVALYDVGDNPVVAAQPACEDFGVTFAEVPDAPYFLEITLLDSSGAPLSDTYGIETDVYADTETVEQIDFADSAIYY